MLDHEVRKQVEADIKLQQQQHSKRLNPPCRFCGGRTRALLDNGVLGSGYVVLERACKDCGKVQ